MNRPINIKTKKFRASHEISSVLSIVLFPAPFKYSYHLYIFFLSFIVENLNDFVRFKDNTDYEVNYTYRITRYDIKMIFDFNS
jgi:hypothetical protein